MKHTAAFLTLFAAAAYAQTTAKPLRGPVTDPGVITTRQSIAPAGVSTTFQGKVWGLAFGAKASEIWVLTAGQVYGMDWRNNTIHTNVAHKGQPGVLGLARADGRVLVSASAGRKSGLFELKDAKLAAVTEGLGSYNAGGLATGGGLAVVPLPYDNKVAVVELATGKLRGSVTTDLVPFAAVVNAEGTVAWVSNWGGRKPKPGELNAPTGLDPAADRVLVDARGIAASGTVTRIDLQAMRVTNSIETGLHPNGVAWDERGGRLYVANNNRDSVTVIDTTANRIVQTFELQPFAKKAPGIAPTAVALNANGSKLYVACGGINAVVVIDTRSGKQDGMIPTGWYPNSVAVSPDGAYLAVGSLLGAGSGWQNEPRRKYVHANRGSVAVVALPDAGQLARYTVAVAESNRLPLAGTPDVSAARTGAAAPKAVPMAVGDRSLIEHVVYIVKENRTYDQLFGDIEKGNGEPSFVMFGEDTTPNQRKLANEFVLLDNFYASGGNSADGHQWLTQANEVAYTMWPGYQGRSYPFDGSDPLGIAQGGTIWDAALAARKSVRIYGEYAGRMATAASARHRYLERWKAGEDLTGEFNTVAPIASMNAILAKNFPSYTTNVPDVVRAQIFLKDLAAWERAGTGLPNLTIIQLPSDHTNGTAAGASTPQAMVADNDLAVGLIVEALSRSKYWPKMAIFVVEDDAQNGVDHVDGHRTVALAISPYIRRGHVDSTFYSHPSLLKTIELMLGLGPLSLFDLIANDMRESFQDKAELQPFEHVVPRQDLFAVNPPVAALRGEARRAAIESAKMRWDIPDAVPSARLNRILWGAVNGLGRPYPSVRNAVFAPYASDADDESGERE